MISHFLDINKIDKKEIIYLCIFLLSFVLFTIGYKNIDQQYFDETHYVKAAIDWIELMPTTNLEHPPLGKLILALFMKIFGTHSFGFRIAPILFGSFSIYAILKIADTYFKDVTVSSCVGLFTISNFWIFVNSRIAMLDIFFVSFLIFGFYFYLRKGSLNFYLSFLMMGLAVATKWSASFVYIPFFLIELVRRRKLIKEYLAGGLLSIWIYYLTFVPYVFVGSAYKISFSQIFINMQLNMWELQKSVGGTHPYLSKWFSWPFMARPIWYEYIFDSVSQTFRGVLMIGNPFQMIMGIWAVISLFVLFKKIDLFTKVILTLFFCSYLIWPITNRHMTFFYYYFPSAMFYSFLVPISLKLVIGNEQKFKKIFLFTTFVSIGFFVYFYPLLAGAPAKESFRANWLWFQSWI